MYALLHFLSEMFMRACEEGRVVAYYPRRRKRERKTQKRRQPILAAFNTGPPQHTDGDGGDWVTGWRGKGRWELNRLGGSSV